MFSDPLGGTPADGGTIADDNFTFDIVDEPQAAPAPPGADAAPAGPAAPAQPVQPSGAPAAQPRDAQPRTTAQPSAAPAAAPAGAPPTPPVAAEAAPEATQAEDPLAAYPVWEVRADGQDFEIPGSRMGTNGVWLDKAAVPLVQQLIAEGVANRGSARQLREQLESENQQLRSRITNDPDILRAKAFNQQIMRILASGAEGMQQFLEDFNNNRQALVANAEQAVLRQQLQERDQQLTTLREQQEATQLEPVMGQAIDNTVAELAGRPEFAGVDANLILERLYSPRGLDAVFYEVDPRERPRGPNEDEFYLGTAADGKLYLMNWGVIVQEFQYQASIRGATPATPAAAAAVNAAALVGSPQGPTTPAAPPGNAGAAGEQVPDFPKTPEGRRQMEQWFERRYSPLRR
jgi:hypothetical protein